MYTYLLAVLTLFQIIMYDPCKSYKSLILDPRCERLFRNKKCITNLGSEAHKLRSARIFLALNLNAINLKLLQIVGHMVIYNLQKLGSIAHKLRSACIFFYSANIFHILDQLGLNLNAINLKLLQIVGITVSKI